MPAPRTVLGRAVVKPAASSSEHLCTRRCAPFAPASLDEERRVMDPGRFRQETCARSSRPRIGSHRIEVYPKIDAGPDQHSYRTHHFHEKQPPTCTSRGGTNIACEMPGRGPALIIVSGALGVRTYASMPHPIGLPARDRTVQSSPSRTFAWRSTFSPPETCSTTIALPRALAAEPTLALARARR